MLRKREAFSQNVPKAKQNPIEGRYNLCSVAICFKGINVEVGAKVTKIQIKPNFAIFDRDFMAMTQIEKMIPIEVAILKLKKFDIKRKSGSKLRLIGKNNFKA